MAKIVFWLGVAAMLAVIPLVVHPIRYSVLVCLPLGAGFSVAPRLVAGSIAERLMPALMVMLALLQVVLVFVISFSTRRRVFLIAAIALVVLLLLDVDGCRMAQIGLSRLS